MACNDVNFSNGKAIQTISTAQTQSDGGLAVGGLLQYDIISQTIPLTGCVSTEGKTVKIVGMDIILDNNGTALAAETLTIYIFDEVPLVGGIAIVPGAAFSDVDDASLLSIVARIELSEISVDPGHNDFLIGSATESEISNYCKTASDSTTLYAVIITESAAPSTIATGATLDTKFKFEGVMS